MKTKYILFLFLTSCLVFFWNTKSEAQLKKINDDWDSFVKEYSIEIQLNDTTNLKKVLQFVNNKKIVFLGENSHFVNEFSIIKRNLIKYFHKNGGVNLLLFEAGLWDVYISFYFKDSLDSKNLMKNSLHQVWWNDENISLMDYLKNSDIKVMGFDCNPSSPFSRGLTKKYFEKFSPQLSSIINTTDSLYFIYQYFNSLKNMSNFTSKKRLEKIDSLKNISSQNYKIILENIGNYRINQSKEDSLTFSIFCRSVSDKLFLMEHSNKKNAGKLRENLMASNIEYIINNIFPNEKAIAWAHNYHIVEMPKLFKNIDNNSVYKLGLYYYSGEVGLMFSQKNKFINKHRKKSIENIIFHSGFRNTFIDFSNQKNRNNSNEWLFRKISSRVGVYNTKIIPNKKYDGIILIDKVSASQIIKFYE